MSVIARQEQEEAEPPRLLRVPWLSGRLILLTLGFVALAQVLVYLPSAASFRREWMMDRIEGARMIALALSSRGAEENVADLDGRMLAGLNGAEAVGIRARGMHWLLASRIETTQTDREIDLRVADELELLRGAFRALLSSNPGHSLIIGSPGPSLAAIEQIEVAVDETALHRAMVSYTYQFLPISLAISAAAALVLYLGLHLMVVRPVRRLSLNIESFAGHPEDAARVIVPSGRQDEIGRAEEALARMERTLARELRQKRHLAGLGLAVSKINHELRNMLTTAQLLGDRLGQVDDPTVRRFAPRLVRTLDRAIAFCGATLAYGRASEPEPRRQPTLLEPLVAEQADIAALARELPVEFAIDVPPGLQVDADPEQLARVLHNLVRNAVEALTRARTPNGRIEISAARRGNSVAIRVADNGPGIPDRSRARLFHAFEASDRIGGTGLGLPVAEEIVRLHGGSIAIEAPSAGAAFLVTIPDRRAQSGRAPETPAPWAA